MEKQTKTILVGAGVVAAAYIAYKLLTRPASAAGVTHTNSGGVFSTGAIGNSSDNVPLDNVGKTAKTNKANVRLLRNPSSVLSLIGLGSLDMTDQVIAAAGTPVGNVVSVSSSSSDPLQTWYKLDKTSTAFLHSGDPLYVNTQDVTF